MPKKRSTNFSASAMAFLTAAASAFAYCDSFPSVGQEFKSSAVVFVGKIKSAREVRIRSESVNGGTFYSVEVEEVLKGAPSKTMELYSENSSSRFPMQVGVQYLVFADDSVFEGISGHHLAVNNCGNSAPVSKARKALATARKLTKA